MYSRAYLWGIYFQVVQPPPPKKKIRFFGKSEGKAVKKKIKRDVSGGYFLTYFLGQRFFQGRGVKFF